VRAGTLVGKRYRLEQRLGGGGMALVYGARDERLDRPVAVKVLADNLAENTEIRRRFLREARLAAQLSHPNVVAVYDAGEQDGRPYIVMEYADGETLAGELRRRGRLPADEASELAAQVAGGLAHAHLAGIVHRDVKPANLIRANGSVKIADFGIAHVLEETRLTQTGTVLGTAAYLAPEQAAGGEVTPAADVYALGAVLYELLAGRPPHSAETLSELLARKRDEPIEPPIAVEPSISPELDALVMRCLALEPERRPAASEVEQALVSGPGAITRLLTPSAAAPTRILRRERPSRKLWLAVLAVAIVVAGTALGVAATQGGGTSHPWQPPPPRVAPVPAGATPAQKARSLARWLRRYSG
jgi:eukaryotic-like serine/threonine-protein kinase